MIRDSKCPVAPAATSLLSIPQCHTWLTSVGGAPVQSGQVPAVRPRISNERKNYAKTASSSNWSRRVSSAFGSLGLRADGPPDASGDRLGTIVHPREAGNGYCLSEVPRNRLEKRTGSSQRGRDNPVLQGHRGGSPYSERLGPDVDGRVQGSGEPGSE